MYGRKALTPLNSIVAEKCIKKRLPFETITKLRRLQDILLESCARNVEEMFLEDTYTFQRTLKRGIKLESDLFERILETGREMRLFMPPYCSRLLLGFRNELGWQNIDLCRLFPGHSDVSERNLLTISRSEVPLRNLTLKYSYEMTVNVLNHISSVAPTLLHLQIKTSDNLWPVYGSSLDVEKLPALKMPKLRSLMVCFRDLSRFLAAKIDISSFSDTIKVVELCNYRSRDHTPTQKAFFTNLLRRCNNVRTLSLQSATLNDEEAYDAFESLGALSSLRCLRLSRVARSCRRGDEAGFDLSRILSHLPNLERLDVSCSDFTCSDPNFLGRKLDYLGAVDVKDKNVLKIPTKVLVSNESYEKLASLLQFLESQVCQDGEFRISEIDKLRHFLSGASSVEKRSKLLLLDRLEKVMLRSVELGHGRPPRKILNFIVESNLFRHLSFDFWAKYVRYYVSHGHHFGLPGVVPRLPL